VIGLIRFVVCTSPLRSPDGHADFYICRFFLSDRSKVSWFELIVRLFVLRRFAPLMDTRIFTSAGFLKVVGVR
jgi:hypothetical protein